MKFLPNVFIRNSVHVCLNVLKTTVDEVDCVEILLSFTHHRLWCEMYGDGMLPQVFQTF